MWEHLGGCLEVRLLTVDNDMLRPVIYFYCEASLARTLAYYLPLFISHRLNIFMFLHLTSRHLHASVMHFLHGEVNSRHTHTHTDDQSKGIHTQIKQQIIDAEVHKYVIWLSGMGWIIHPLLAPPFSLLFLRYFLSEAYLTASLSLDVVCVISFQHINAHRSGSKVAIFCIFDHLCVQGSSQVHSRTSAVPLSWVLFDVWPIYQEDICLISWHVLVLFSRAAAFWSHVVENIFTLEVAVV